MPKQEQHNKPDEPPGGTGWTARRFLENSRNLDKTVQKNATAIMLWFKALHSYSIAI